MKTGAPRPGQPVRGSETGKPIMALFDLLGRSWALGIVWQLSGGALTFRALQEKCETVSPTVLNKRLGELQETGLVQKEPRGYALTNMGQGLFRLLQPMASFSISWAESFKNHEDSCDD